MPFTDTAILSIVADNQMLFDALKKLLLEQFEITGAINDTDTNEILGQQVRSYLEGRKKVEEAFKEIAQLKTVSTTNTITLNPAR